MRVISLLAPKMRTTVDPKLRAIVLSVWLPADAVTLALAASVWGTVTLDDKNDAITPM